jgi:signal transduction histidine kinase
MPGSGLGLAIVSQFAEDNDANTYVLDNAGGGTVVGLQFK